MKWARRIRIACTHWGFSLGEFWDEMDFTLFGALAQEDKREADMMRKARDRG